MSLGGSSPSSGSCGSGSGGSGGSGSCGSSGRCCCRCRCGSCGCGCGCSSCRCYKITFVRSERIGENKCENFRKFCPKNVTILFVLPPPSFGTDIAKYC